MIRILGTYSFSKSGTVYGPSWLSASDSDFRFEWLAGKPYVIPIEYIAGIKPMVVIPWLSWGIQIDHTYDSVQSPIYFGTNYERPSRLISKLTDLPFNTGISIDFSTKQGLFPC